MRDGQAGRLRIGFSPSAPHHVLPTLIRSFRRRHPGVECMLSELPSDTQVEQILAGDIDVGILRPPTPVPPSVTCTAFLEEPFGAVHPGRAGLKPPRTRRLTISTQTENPIAK